MCEHSVVSLQICMRVEGGRGGGGKRSEGHALSFANCFGLIRYQEVGSKGSKPLLAANFTKKFFRSCSVRKFNLPSDFPVRRLILIHKKEKTQKWKYETHFKIKMKIKIKKHLLLNFSLDLSMPISGKR